MADVFISYRRKPSASLAHLLQERLQSHYNLSVYLDTTRTDSAKVQFPDRLLSAIETSSVFVCLLADSTLESEWVLKEIERAFQREKPCLPVFQESYQPHETDNPAVDYLLSFDGVHVLDDRGLYMDEAVQKIAGIILKTLPQRRTARRLYPMLLAAIVLVVVGAVIFLTRPGDTNGHIVETATDLPTAMTTEAGAATGTEAPTDEMTLTPTNTHEPTPTALPSPTRTAEPTPTREPVIEGVTNNTEWTPLERDFDGIRMMLVPPGCFQMGSTDGDNDEQPVEEQCFDWPFWIAKTETTNGQYGSSGRWDGADYPRENVAWGEAKAFCESRGLRLPTEAEWEYAGRGPDGLIYPWGDTYNAENVVDRGSSGDRTQPVGSRPSGASWVGALDMSGNVWEWISTVYHPYPYSNDAIRENPLDTGAFRVFRGGSWSSGTPYNTRLTFRSYQSSAVSEDFLGFRCAADFEAGQIDED